MAARKGSRCGIKIQGLETRVRGPIKFNAGIGSSIRSWEAKKITTCVLCRLATADIEYAVVQTCIYRVKLSCTELMEIQDQGSRFRVFGSASNGL
jgi:hypothetical protein